MHTKDDSIVELVARLELPRRGWLIVDHWEGDPCAVGISSIARPDRLVYVSTFGKPSGLYGYERELPPRYASEPYCPAGGDENVGFDELLTVLIQHLAASEVQPTTEAVDQHETERRHDGFGRKNNGHEDA